MALPIRDFVASQAVQVAMAKCRALRDNTQNWKARVDAGTTADIVLNMALGVKQTRDTLHALGQVVGIDAAAKSEYGDGALNFSAELASVVSACDDCLSWISANFPKDASGYLLDRKLVGGEIVNRSFSPAALSGLSSQLQLLLNAFS